MIGLILALVALTFAAYLIARNLRHNEPGLTGSMTLVLALSVAGAGLFAASRLTGPAEWIALGSTVLAVCRFFFMRIVTGSSAIRPAGSSPTAGKSS